MIDEDDPKKPAWFCGCGGSNPDECLKAILNAYTRECALGPYLDLAAFSEVYKKYHADAVELILYLLDHLDYVGHTGSVSSSSYLTESGIELREWANGR